MYSTGKAFFHVYNCTSRVIFRNLLRNDIQHYFFPFVFVQSWMKEDYGRLESSWKEYFVRYLLCHTSSYLFFCHMICQSFQIPDISIFSQFKFH